MNVKEYLEQIDVVNEKGKYTANWQSLSHHKTPDWYYNGKLGIFIRGDIPRITNSGLQDRLSVTC